jgi:hypothetical protein
MESMRGSAALALLTVAALAGCTLLAPLGDLRGTGDASTEGGPVPDGGRDGAMYDAVALADGGRFCDGVDARFCDDFDDVDAQFARWFAPTLTNGGVVELGFDGAASPPAFLRTRVSSPMGTNPAEAALLMNLPARSTLTVSSRVRVARRPMTGATEIQQISAQGATWYLYVRIGPFGDEFVEEYAGADVGFAQQPTPCSAALGDDWTLVTTTVDLGMGQAVLSYDGTTVAQLALVKPPPPTGTQRVQGGQSWVFPPTGGAIVDIDDVVVR